MEQPTPDINATFKEIMDLYVLVRKEATVPVKTQFLNQLATTLPLISAEVKDHLFAVVNDSFTKDANLHQSALKAFDAMLCQESAQEAVRDVFVDLVDYASKNLETNQGIHESSFCFDNNAEWRYNTSMDALDVICKHFPDWSPELAQLGPRGADIALKHAGDKLQALAPQDDQKLAGAAKRPAKTRRPRDKAAAKKL